jgi:hypothetical protein
VLKTPNDMIPSHNKRYTDKLLFPLPDHVGVVIIVCFNDAGRPVGARVAGLDLKLLEDLQQDPAIARREGPNGRVVVPVVRLRGASTRC